MMKLNALLLVALVASALLLVKTAFESRQLFAALDNAKQEKTRLDAEYKRLDAEAQQQSTNSRVEKVAKERLGMARAQQGVMTYVFDAPASAATAATAAAAAPGGAR